MSEFDMNQLLRSYVRDESEAGAEKRQTRTSRSAGSRTVAQDQNAQGRVLAT